MASTTGGFLIVVGVMVLLVSSGGLYAVQALSATTDQSASVGSAADVHPAIVPLDEYIYRTSDYEIKITIPRYINLSNFTERQPAALDLYMRKLNPAATLGLFDIDVEAGIMTRVSVPFGVSVHLFVDVDVNVSGSSLYDIFAFKWPISGIPLGMMSLANGSVGVYPAIVPLKEAEGDLGQLTMDEWTHVGAYKLSVLQEPFTILSLSPGDVTIGPPSQVEESVDWKAEYEKLLGTYTQLQEDYGNLTLSLQALNQTLAETVAQVKSLQEQLSEAQTVLQASMAEKTAIRATLDQAQAELNTTRTELDAVRSDYDTLKTSYTSLKENYDYLKASYDMLKKDYDSLKAIYDGLKTEHESTARQLEIKISELETRTNLMYLFIITTIAFLAATAFLTMKKRKVGIKTESK